MPISTAVKTEIAYQRCLNDACRATFGVGEPLFACSACGDLLDVVYEWDRAQPPDALRAFEAKWAERHDPLAFSGVWRFRELLPFADPKHVVTIGEGQTILQRADSVARYVGLDPGRLGLQYEGMNPSGSFKDNGMTAAFTHARMAGAKRAACASTGNTSASLAVFCAATRLLKAVIFVGSGKIAYGKLAQALDHGALTVQISGDFDDAMQRVQEVSRREGIYLVNSLNPFRLEGQKAIMYRVLEALGWEVPDWIVVPGGNLGNASAFGKAFAELLELGLIEGAPRLAVINAAGADTFYQLVEKQGLRWRDYRVQGSGLRVQGGRAGAAGAVPPAPGSAAAAVPAAVQRYYHELDAAGRRASTIASAIEINRPVNLKKALRALEVCDGIVRAVSDQEIMDAKAQVGAGGLGCEPASAASVAGAKRLREEGVIARGDRVVCILTGHLLKDPTATVSYHTTDQDQFNQVLGRRGVRRASFANRAVSVANDLEEIVRAIRLYS